MSSRQTVNDFINEFKTISVDLGFNASVIADAIRRKFTSDILESV